MKLSEGGYIPHGHLGERINKMLFMGRLYTCTIEEQAKIFGFNVGGGMSEMDKILSMAQGLKSREITDLIEKLKLVRKTKPKDIDTLMLYPTAKNERNAKVIFSILNGKKKSDVAKENKTSVVVVNTIERSFYRRFKSHYKLICPSKEKAVEFYELLYKPILTK